MKKIKLIGIAILSISLLGACSTNEKKVSVSKGEKTSQSSKKEEKKEPVKSEQGKRSNPVKIGEVASLKEKFFDDSYKPHDGKLDISITEVKKGDEAWGIISQANMFNEKAPEGYEWFLVKAKVTVSDLDSDDIKYKVYNSFKPFDSNGQSIDQSVSVVSPDPQFDGEIFKGGTIEGYFTFIAKTNDKVLLEYKGNTADCFFTLQ